MDPRKYKSRRGQSVDPDGHPTPQRFALHEWDDLDAAVVTLTDARRMVTPPQGVHDVSVNEESREAWSARSRGMGGGGASSASDASDDEDSSSRGRKAKRRRRDASSPSEEENPQTRRSRSKPLPKIGPDHQVDALPDVVATTSEDNASNQVADMIWDPAQATPEVWNWLDTKQCQGDEMTALRALHECDYNVAAADNWLADKVEVRIDHDVFFEIFRNTQMGKEKKFDAIAKMFGTSVSQVLKNYYLWKGRRPKDYQRFVKAVKKDEEQSDREWCAVCDDGGFLIECSGDCNRSFHLDCVRLDSVPSGDWFCLKCDATRSGWARSLEYVCLDHGSYILDVPITPGKGLGLRVVSNKGMAIISEILRPDIPAEVGVGDRIVAINDVSVENQTFSQIMARLIAYEGRLSQRLKMRQVRPVTGEMFGMPEYDATAESHVEDVSHVSARHRDSQDASAREEYSEKQSADVTPVAQDTAFLGEKDGFLFESDPEVIDATKNADMHMLRYGVEFGRLGDTEYYELRFADSASDFDIKLCARNGRVCLHSFPVNFQGEDGPKEGDCIVMIDGKDMKNSRVEEIARKLQKDRQGCARVLRLQRSAVCKTNRDVPMRANLSGSGAQVTAISCSDSEYELYFPVNSKGFYLKIRTFDGEFYLDALTAEVTGFQGRKDGDRILKVDGVEISKLSLKDAANLLGNTNSAHVRVIRLSCCNSITKFQSSQDRHFRLATKATLKERSRTEYYLELPVPTNGELGIQLKEADATGKVRLGRLFCEIECCRSNAPREGDEICEIDGRRIVGLALDDVNLLLKDHEARLSRALLLRRRGEPAKTTPSLEEEANA